MFRDERFTHLNEVFTPFTEVTNYKLAIAKAALLDEQESNGMLAKGYSPHAYAIQTCANRKWETVFYHLPKDPEGIYAKARKVNPKAFIPYY
jgi:hypothetical protein